MKQPFVGLMAACLCLSLSGQEPEFGVIASLAAYDGDLAPKKPELLLHTLRPAYGIWGKWHLSPRWAVRLSAQAITLAGSDALSQRPRGLHFQTGVAEYSLSGEYRLSAFALGKGEAEWIPYLHFGAGRIRFMPRARADGRWIDLQPLGTEGQGIKGYPLPYPTSASVYPYGAGLQLLLDGRWGFALEYTARFTQTDYLDDVSTGRVPYAKLMQYKGAEIARLSRPGFDPASDDPLVPYVRGGAGRDWYYSAGLALSYRVSNHIRIGARPPRKRVRCPK
ncbi:MAG: hypothetical protein IPH16_14520 [Haliscomenobacter sp.]|nr:hypothetical protein [Haliscomenobacter sp.]MBK7477956.1 hypothetical protein [Haliscomenobacter sp.]MBK8878247.1 hypothetical protein [Haliscomenobacter sp.]